MSNVDLSVERLSNQRITGSNHTRIEEVVRWMGALQAQDYGQAVWALGLRTQHAKLSDVERALAAKLVVRTWPMRGTIHFVLPQDAQWMVKLSAPRTLAAARLRHANLGLDEAILERCKQLFYDALKGGRNLSRPRMMEVLNNAGISTDNQRGYHILWYAAQTGLICIGPMQGKQQTFLLLDEVVPGMRSLSREDALFELAERYYASHGPATIHDFAWWAGLSIGEARFAIQIVQSRFVSETMDGKTYWMLESALDTSFDLGTDVHLLPGFDEFLLGYTDRSAMISPDHSQKVVPWNNGMFKPVVVIGGQVVGTWKRTIKKSEIEITFECFKKFKMPEDSLFAAAQRYCDFMELPLRSITIQ